VSSNDYKKAAINPTTMFASPEEVLRRADLSAAQKLHLLRRWRYEARELSPRTRAQAAASSPCSSGSALP
jgi:hypothetical protein